MPQVEGSGTAGSANSNASPVAENVAEVKAGRPEIRTHSLLRGAVWLPLPSASPRPTRVAPEIVTPSLNVMMLSKPSPTLLSIEPQKILRLVRADGKTTFS